MSLRNLVATRLTDLTVIGPIIISLLNHEGQPILISNSGKLYKTAHSAFIVGHTDIPGGIKTMIFYDFRCLSPSLNATMAYFILCHNIAVRKRVCVNLVLRMRISPWSVKQEF